MKEHNMKRIIVLLATLLLSFGLANAIHKVDVGIPEIDDTLRIGVPSQFIFSFENDVKWGGYSMGFQIYSGGGATWTWANTGGLGTKGAIKVLAGCRQDPPGTVWDLGGFQLNEVDMNNATPDVFLIGGVAMMQGMQPGPLQAMVTADFVPGGPTNELPENIICVDSIFVPPAGNFVWVDALGGAHTPDVVWPIGEKCWPVYPARNFCPDWAAGNPTTMTTSHCLTGNAVLNVTDVESNPADFALKALNGGGGTATVTKLSGTSCRVSYAPVAGDVGATITIDVDVWDAYNPQGGCEAATISVTVTNNPPTIVCGKNPEFVGKGNTLVKTDIDGSDLDGCDVLQYTLIDEVPDFATAGSVDLVTGDYTVATAPDLTDVGDHVVTVEVTDGIATAQCSFTVSVLRVEPWEVQIEKTHATLQGHFVDVNLTLNKGSEAVGGFDFLIGYDASALAFTEAALGDYFVDCGWEYFTYRFNWNGNCGNGCPTGLLRVVGLAETNNGANHPDAQCILNGVGQTLVTLTFFVSNDRTLECMYVPIRFYWMDCGDNTISTMSGDTLAINRYIFDFETNEIQDYGYGFPGYLGAPDDPCLDGDKVKPIRFIDFLNGGVDIVCGDSIDDRGDINMNGVKNEIADAVMFTNYFINGLSAFGSHIEASIAASDVNADGIALSVADLVYQIRVIIGDAQPYDKPMPGASVALNAQGGVVTYEAPVNIGAALLTFQVNGEVGTPVLGAGAANMDIKSAQEGNELRVLIYNIGSNYIAAGENVLVTVPGNVTLTGAEVASYQGYGVDALVRNLPTQFAVTNFPNPFNPKTTIALNMPVASDYSVKIYNVAGQLVKEYSGYAEAGTLNVVWDGTDAGNNTVASGIYFYKAEAGQFSATKKMVLMK
jgi:hypothetical protein